MCAAIIFTCVEAWLSRDKIIVYSDDTGASFEVFANFAYGVWKTREYLGTETQVTLHSRDKYDW